MSDLYFGSDIFSEFECPQRRIDELFGCFPPSTRSVRCGGFAPGMEPEQR
jgi:HSP20 family protein